MGAVPASTLVGDIWRPPDVMASEDIPGNDPWWFRHLFQRLGRVIEDSKSDLRRHFRALRSRYVTGLTDAERAIAFSKAPSPLAAHFQQGSTVAAYIPVGSEADPMALLRQAHDAGCQTALPYVSSRTSPLQFLRWSPDDELHDGPFGLRQPSTGQPPCAPDVVLVPLVAFDSRLLRLGQGAGHYDRALSLLPICYKVGIAWSVQQADGLPNDPWDVPLDAILTEKAWIA
jgi:5-formyltetrahydrofolate cyclo-ligase